MVRRRGTDRVRSNSPVERTGESGRPKKFPFCRNDGSCRRKLAFVGRDRQSGSGGMERPFWRGCAWNTEFPANPVAMRDAGRAACTTEINVSACPIRLRERESFGAFLYDFVALSGRSFPISYSVRTVDFSSLRAWPRFRYDFYGGVRVVKPVRLWSRVSS